MKKIISFEKELDFPSMIGEITSISLDNNLKFIDQNSVAGNFNIKGTYKMTEASTLEEKFTYDIPVDITLVETFDLSSVKVSIDNFYYEIVNDDILKCNIDVLIDGIEQIIIEDEEELKTEEIEQIKLEQEKQEEIDIRECDGDKKEEKEEKQIKEIEEINEIETFAFKPVEETKKLDKELNITEKEEENEIEENIHENNNISSLFEAFESTEETFKTYSIYILRKDDTLESIMDKYNVTKEELSDYNDLNNLEIGMKLIIPSTINE